MERMERLKSLYNTKIVHPELPDLYNLGFGHSTDDGNSIDDKVRANNGDMMKVLSTVAFTVNDFIEHHPDKAIYIRGSDAVRTRAYQMAINKYYDEIAKDYEIYGHIFTGKIKGEKGEYQYEPFQKNKNYYGFLAIKK